MLKRVVTANFPLVVITRMSVTCSATIHDDVMKQYTMTSYMWRVVWLVWVGLTRSDESSRSDGAGGEHEQGSGRRLSPELGVDDDDGEVGRSLDRA